MESEQQFVGTRAASLRSRLVLHNFYDLLVMALFAILQLVLLAAPPTWPWLRVPLGLAMSLFVPGYAIAVVAFPRRLNHDGLVRMALSIGLSAALLPPLALLLDATPLGIRPSAITLSLSLFIIVLSIIAMWQRLTHELTPQTYLPPSVGMMELIEALKQYGWIKLVTGAAIAIVAGVLLIILFAPNPATHMTEFYVLSKDGLAEDYPRTVSVDEEMKLTLGLVNREASPQTYRVEAWAVDGLDHDRRVLLAQNDSITISPGQTARGEIVLRMPWAGDDQTVEFLLYTKDKPEPYRQLRLWLNVVEPSPKR